MKKTILTFAVVAALMLSLAGCGDVPAAENTAPAAEPQVTEEVLTPPEGEEQTAPAEPSEAPEAPARQDGERFETTIVLEGMEETVHYEHIVNTALGFEMDYDYENFVRRSDGDRECFISVWDDPDHPENYLEVTCSSEDAETAAASIIERLSQDFDVTQTTRVLDYAGECIWIEASVIKGTNNMAEQLQWVTIIPAPDGCRIATAHSFIAESEGFSRRFGYLLDTLVVTERKGESGISDEQALAAIRNYCYASNPDLEEIVNGGEYQVGWEIVSSDEQQIVVLFRSYTGAELRYYIDRATGETYVTEYVPGITSGEERTEESFNVRDYAD